MFYPRIILPLLKKHFLSKEITVITGMRRTGKTAILRELYNSVSDNKAFIDLENRANHELFLVPDYEEILRRLRQIYGINTNRQATVFIDEIQMLPAIPSILKYLFDHYNIKFMVTGSSSFYLKNLFGESLAGRKQIFELFPLTFDEFLVFGGRRSGLSDDSGVLNLDRAKFYQDSLASPYEEYLRFGGFPGVVLAADPKDKEAKLKDILYSYIDQDVRMLTDFAKIDAMEKLIRLLVPRIGQKMEIAAIASVAGLSRATVIEYLEFLEKTYVIFCLPPFTRSAGREISKAKKLYFCDTGLANVLGSLSSGQQLENAVCQTLRVKFKPKKAFDTIRYYQKKSGAEIDFILGEEIAMEVKETASAYDQRRTSRLATKLGIKESTVVSLRQSQAGGVVYASGL